MTTAAVVAATTLAIVPLTDDAVRTEVDRTVAQVAAVRHLPFRGTLPARAVTRDAVEAQIAAALAARLTSSNLGAEERILKRLGLIGSGADYTKLWAAGPTSAPVATYDPSAQRLLVPDFLPLDEQRVALIHEIAHAVTDRRFDLRQFLAPPPPSPLEGDATRARLALVEGDATLASMEVVDPTLAFLRPTTLRALAERLRVEAGEGRPPWLAALGRFVHVDGFLFAAQVRARQPWSAVDALWRDPPDSSEQVLHREKYETCEAPIAVPEAVLPALPGFDRPKASDVLGELAIRAWLSTALADDVAGRAAAGWGGDRAAIYSAAATITARPDGGVPAISPPPLLWLTVWDDSGEADEFARAAEAVAGDARVQRRVEAVAIFLGPPDLAALALESTLESWRASKGDGRRRGRVPAASRAPARCLRSAR